MSVNDVPIVLQPNSQHLGFSPSLAADRLTLQHFQNADHITVFAAPHNSDARHCVGHDDWPPPLLFDVSYGCAALHTWGVPDFVNLTRQHTRDVYYDDGNDDNGNGGGGNGGGGNGSGGGRGSGNGGGGGGQPDVEPMTKRALRVAAREKVRQKMRAVDSQTPDLAEMILAFWMHNARKGQRQARAAKAEKTQEKVRTWLDSTKD
jgi:hypothetical protein